MLWHWICQNKKISHFLFLWLYKRRQRFSLHDLSQMSFLYLSISFFFLSVFFFFLNVSFFLFVCLFSFCLLFFLISVFSLFFLFLLVFISFLSYYLFIFFLSFFLFVFLWFPHTSGWSAVVLLLWIELDLEECPILFNIIDTRHRVQTRNMLWNWFI